MIPECAQYDSAIFYKLREGNCEFINREFSNKYLINSLGVRDDEASLSYPDVVVIGDSFAMGWGVSQDSTFSNLLESWSGLKILNTAISSFGTAREMKILQSVKLDSLKILIIQYHPNDLVENKAYYDNGNSLLISSEDVYNDKKNEIDNRNDYFIGKNFSQILKYKILGKNKTDPNLIVTSDSIEVAYFLNALYMNKELLNRVNIIVFEVNQFDALDADFTLELENQTIGIENSMFFKKMNIVTMHNVLERNDFYILDDHANESGHLKIAQSLIKYLE